MSLNPHQELPTDKLNVALYAVRTPLLPGATPRTGQPLTPEQVQAEIASWRERPEGPLSWRKMAALPRFSGVTPAALCAFYKHNREPQNNHDRAILGLPELGLGEICPIHHKVCAVKHHGPRRPARKYHPWKKSFQFLWGAYLGLSRAVSKGEAA